MPTSALQFLRTRLLDRRAGGCYGATDATGEHPLTTDKQLTDQSSAVLALAAEGDDEDVRVAVDGLRGMQDRGGNPGFAELTDRYWRAYPPGRVRTPRYQMYAAAALLAAAYRLDDDELRARAVDLLNRCLSLARDGVFPTKLTEDWQDTLGQAPSPLTAVSAVRALAVAESVGEFGVDASSLPAIAGRLLALVEQASWPTPAPELTRCSSLARMALSLVHAGRMLGRQEYLKAADSVLTLAASFHDPDDGGFWDRLCVDGTVRVEWGHEPRAGHSPFPVKRAADAAHLLMAGELLGSYDFDTGPLIAQARASIAELSDDRYGGVFLGIGYQWATSADPVAPVVHQLWSHPAHPGLVLGDALGHLALQQKSAHTQASVARVARAEQPAPEAAPQPYTVRHVAPKAALLLTPWRLTSWRLTPWRREPAPAGGDGQQDIPALLAAHRPRSVFSSYHTIVDLCTLTEHTQPTRDLVKQVLSARQDDGSFGELPEQLGDIASTYRATVVLALAGVDLPGETTRDYLRSAQNRDGGFGAVPGMNSDVAHTHFALAALRLLGSGPDRQPAAAAFVLAARHSDGGYGNRPGRPANGFAVRHGIAALRLSNGAVPEPETTKAWVRATQASEGGFSHRPGRPASMLATYHAVAALAMLDDSVAAAEGCRRWLAVRREAYGLLEPHTGAGGAADDGFAHRQTLAILQGVVDPTWLAVIS